MTLCRDPKMGDTGRKDSLPLEYDIYQSATVSSNFVR